MTSPASGAGPAPGSRGRSCLQHHRTKTLRSALGRWVNATVERLAARGLTPSSTVSLEIVDRRSGLPRRTAVGRARNAGRDHVVSLAGESEWVRDLRAAGGAALIRHGDVRQVRLTEVPVPERAPILHAHLRRPSVEQLARLADRCPVFEIGPVATRIAEGVHVVALGRGVLASNVYLIRSAESFVLVDAGWPGEADAIAAAAAGVFGVDARAEAILLTHSHLDHAGSATELARRWQVPVYVHRDELPNATVGYVPQYANPLDRIVVPAMRLVPARKAASGGLAEVVRGLDDDGSVPGLPGWTAVPAPGHTPGEVAFHRPADGVLITGDAVLTVDLNSLRGIVGNRRRIGGPPWYTTWSRPAATTSIAALAALEPVVLAPGHGHPLTAGAAPALHDLVDRLAAAHRPLEGFGRPVDFTAPIRYRRPPPLYARLQPLGWLLTRLGLSPRHAVVLEVPGRRSGVLRRTNLVQADLRGEHYLVSLAGESEWVRNVRAAAGRAVLGRRELRAVTLVEVPVPDRPSVIRAYLDRTAGRAAGRARAARAFFGVDGDASDEELHRVADRYPVFRVHDAPDRAPARSTGRSGERAGAGSGAATDGSR